jgi:hypothetical protein
MLFKVDFERLLEKRPYGIGRIVGYSDTGPKLPSRRSRCRRHRPVTTLPPKATSDVARFHFRDSHVFRPVVSIRQSMCAMMLEAAEYWRLADGTWKTTRWISWGVSGMHKEDAFRLGT